MTRFHKLQAKVPDDDKDNFTKALNGWFDLAAGATRGIKFSKYKAKFGEDAIRLADDPQGMFEQITEQILGSTRAASARDQPR